MNLTRRSLLSGLLARLPFVGRWFRPVLVIKLPNLVLKPVMPGLGLYENPAGEMVRVVTLPLVYPKGSFEWGMDEWIPANAQEDHA